MSRGVDVAVVGAGIVGCTIAFECALRRARTVLLDRGEPGGEASGAAAGMLAPLSEAEAPGPFLDLCREGLRRWPGLAARLLDATGIDCELVLDGLLGLALDPADVPARRRRLDWQAGLPVPGSGRWLATDDVAGLEPSCGPTAGAAFYPDEGHVHGARSIGALLAAAQQLGVEVRREAEVVGLDAGGALRLACGDVVDAEVVIVAAGAWSGGLAVALGGSRLPVRPVRGQLVALGGLARLPRRVLFGGLLGYALARRDGTLIVGATAEDAGFESGVTEAATAQLLATARRLVPDAAHASRREAVAGLRPGTPDTLPLLGVLPGTEDRRRPRVLVATGHYRNGILLAPVTAYGVAQMALDGVVPDGWEAFDPRRLA